MVARRWPSLPSEKHPERLGDGPDIRWPAVSYDGIVEHFWCMKVQRAEPAASNRQLFLRGERRQAKVTDHGLSIMFEQIARLDVAVVNCECRQSSQSLSDARYRFYRHFR